MRVVLLALLVLNVAFAANLPSSIKVTPPGAFATYADFNCAGPSQTSVCFCPNIWSMKPINPVYAVPDMNITSYDTNYRYFFQAPVLRYGATPGVPQNSSGGGPWMHHDATKPCYWNTNTGEVKCSFRLRATPSASSTYLGSTTITSNSLTSVTSALSTGLNAGIANVANSGYSVGGNLTLTTTLVSGAAGLAAAAGYSARDQLIFAELANPVTLIIRRAWEYPAIANKIPDMKQGPSDPAFLFANRVSQSYSRYKKLAGADTAWHMALWGADNPVATKVAIDLYFDMLTCDTTPPTPNGGGTPEEICLDVVPQVKQYCPPAQTSTQVSSNTNAVALSFTSTGC